MMQDTQSPESNFEMEGVMSDISPINNRDPEGPIKEISSKTNRDDASYTYDRTRFIVNKAWRRYQTFYKDCKIIVERGFDMANLAHQAPRIQTVLDIQGWTNMVEDHHPIVVELVHEFYANLHMRCGNSFHIWLKGKLIIVTPTPVRNITGEPRVCDPGYPWPVNGFPTRT
jgi:hypothetical protein